MAAGRRAAARRPSPRAERRLIERLRTPLAVQRFLNALDYNMEPPPGRATLRSFRGVVRHQTAHCLEAALLRRPSSSNSTDIPPLVLSFESIDELDHVIFVYRRKGRWGSVARSRDPGLHGRKPVFATPRALALSYVDPYVDFTGRVTGYAVVDLRPARRLRLAAVRAERLESRAHAARLSAPGDYAAPTNASTACGGATSRTGDGSDRSRSTTAGWIGGRSCRQGNAEC